MKNNQMQILRGQTFQNSENLCKTEIKTSVLESEVKNLSSTLKEHKIDTDKNFRSLEKSFENQIKGLQDYMKKDFDDLKNAIEKQDDKLKKIETEVSNVKVDLSSWVAKCGVVFAILSSVGAFFLNMLFEKVK